MASPLKCPMDVPKGRSASLSTSGSRVPTGASQEDGTGPGAGLRGHTHPSWLAALAPEQLPGTDSARPPGPGPAGLGQQSGYFPTV